eukprot:5325574-Pyramimonas_sp.AAC.1
MRTRDAVPPPPRRRRRRPPAATSVRRDPRRILDWLLAEAYGLSRLGGAAASKILVRLSTSARAPRTQGQ